MYPLLIILLFNLISSQSYYYPWRSFSVPNYMLYNRNIFPNKRFFAVIPPSNSQVATSDSVFTPIQNDKPSLYSTSSHTSSSSSAVIPASPDTNKESDMCKNANIKLDYGKCPQLEPKEEDKKLKEDKTKECLKDLDLNENTTIELVTTPIRDRIRECLLRKSELLNDAGKYQYAKALEKLKAKGLEESIQKKLEGSHVECKIGSEAYLLTSPYIMPAVDLYTKCMDFHIKMICEVKEVKEQNMPIHIPAINIPTYDGVAILADAI